MSFLSSTELARAIVPHQPWVNPALGPAVLPRGEALQLRFVHFETTCAPPTTARAGTSYGVTTWVASTSDRRCVALTFPWALIERNVLCAADMLAISSNLYLTDGDGRQMPDQERWKVLARLVHDLPWQGAVWEQLPEAQGCLS